MLYPNSIALLAALLSVSTTLASPTPASAKLATRTVDVEDSFEHKNATLSKRAHCWPGSRIRTSDIEALHNDLQSRGGDFFLGRQSSVTYTYGTARVCIDNNYIFETTQASNWEAGWGVKQMKEECCHGDTCGGGIQIGHGNARLSLNIVTKTSAQLCL